MGCSWRLKVVDAGEPIRAYWERERGWKNRKRRGGNMVN
jgi:hypothetical protein